MRPIGAIFYFLMNYRAVRVCFLYYRVIGRFSKVKKMKKNPNIAVSVMIMLAINVQIARFFTFSLCF